MPKCFYCDADLIWQSDVMMCEINDFYEGDEDSICTYYTCSGCGMNYEVYPPTKDELEKFYNESKNNKDGTF